MTGGATTVAVVGAGAIGTVVAAAAVSAGHRVTVCTRRPETGRTLVRDDRRTTVDAVFTDDPDTVSPVDWIMLTTKAHHVAGTRPWFDALARDSTRVVVCQNGIDHHARVAWVEPVREVLPAVVGIMAQQTEPDVVVHSGGDRLTVGDTPGGRDLRDAFATSWLDVVLVDDVERASWCKLLGNVAAAPVTTLLRQPMRILRRPELEPLLRVLLAEAVAVGRAAGVDLRESDVDATMAALSALPGDVRSSMEVDVSSGRSLELEEITGAVVARADALSIDVPVNSALLSILRTLDPGGPPCHE